MNKNNESFIMGSEEGNADYGDNIQQGFQCTSIEKEEPNQYLEDKDTDLNTSIIKTNQFTDFSSQNIQKPTLLLKTYLNVPEDEDIN